ncbi:hypothetical protein [Candidatus Nanohalovita haloferacivicina]
MGKDKKKKDKKNNIKKKGGHQPSEDPGEKPSGHTVTLSDEEDE